MMKRFNHVFLLILMALTVFNACEKDELETTNVASCGKEKLQDMTNSGEFRYDLKSKVNYSVVNMKLKGFKGLNGSTQILVFKDIESFKFILHELERQTDELDSAFVSYYGDLEEEALNDKEIEVRFSEAQPLSLFEKRNGFNSLRKQVAAEEERWLIKKN